MDCFSTRQLQRWFRKRVLVVSAFLGDDLREVARGGDLRGLSGCLAVGHLYSSSAGSTGLYPPMFNLQRSPARRVIASSRSAMCPTLKPTCRHPW